MNTKRIVLSAIIAALPFTANATQTIVQTQTPAAVGVNGTINRAATSGPYQTATIGEHDDEHIATTAYVKGAYNDAIAAVNKVSADNSQYLDELRDDLDYKQELLENGTNNNAILPKVLTGSNFAGLENIMLHTGTDPLYADEYDAIAEDVAYNLTGEFNNAAALNDTLISAGTVMQWMRTAGDAINEKANASDVQNKLTTTVNNQSQNISSTIAQAVNTTTPSATTLVSEAAIASAINGQTTALNSKRVTVYTTWGVDDGTAVTQVPFSTAQ